MPGDLNQDGNLDADDIELLAAMIRAGTADLRFDLNGDGLIDARDHEVLVVDLIGAIHGDLDLDGDVDIGDLAALAAHFAMVDARWSQGDINGDGVVDIADLARLASTFGSLNGGAAASLTVVPQDTRRASMNLARRSNQAIYFDRWHVDR